VKIAAAVAALRTAVAKVSAAAPAERGPYQYVIPAGHNGTIPACTS
jgi:hypothetical protein